MKKRLREEIEEEGHRQNGDGDHEPRPEQSIYPDAGKWVRGRLLGWGAFGWVYLAIMKEQGSRFTGFCPRVMAVKSSYTSQSEELKKEKVLLDVLADSPFIIRCFGDDITIADDNREVLNVFLEYASGGSLANLIENSKGLGLREQQVKRYTESILRGIQCIHEMGFVHCDLKPENILLVKEGDNDDDDDEDFVAKIADFGLSKRADNWVSTTPALGTREYLAPECRINKVQEQCSDIWALGCIVLKMLTTRLIWDSNASNSISREANDFLIKCFESNPNVRPSAETLLSHPFVCGLEIIDLTSEEEVTEEEQVEEYQCEEEEDMEEEEYLEEETEEVEEGIEVRPYEEEEEDLCEEEEIEQDPFHIYQWEVEKEEDPEEEMEEYQCEEEENIGEETEEVEEEIEVCPCEEEELEHDPCRIYQWEVEKEEDPEEEMGEYQCEEEGVEEDDLEEEIEKNPEEGEEEREVYTYEEEEEVEHDPLHIYQREEDEEAEEDPFEEEEECGYLTPTICLKQPVFTGIGAA